MMTMMQHITPNRLLTLAVVLALLVTGHGVRAEDDIERMLAQAGAQWDTAFNSGDADGVTALYADDAMLVPPGGEVVHGRAAIQSFWAGLVEAGFGDHAIELVEVRHGGADLAYVVANWQATGPDDEGARTTYSGRLVNIFQRQADGEWRSVTHIWN